MLDTIETWFAGLWKRVKGWKTMIASALVAAVGVMEAADWSEIVPDENKGLALMLIGVAFAVLRAVTTTPVGGKD